MQLTCKKNGSCSSSLYLSLPLYPSLYLPLYLALPLDTALFCQRGQRLDNCKICTQAQKRAMSLSAEPSSRTLRTSHDILLVPLMHPLGLAAHSFWHFRQLRGECRT